MPYHIVTIPFNQEGEYFQSDEINEFCLNKKIIRAENNFFQQNGKSYWTVSAPSEYRRVLRTCRFTDLQAEERLSRYISRTAIRPSNISFSEGAGRATCTPEGPFGIFF